MSKTKASLKRKSDSTQNSETKTPKSVKKSKKELPTVPEEAPLLTVKELCARTGLSDFMLGVVMDLLDKSSGGSPTLIDFIVPNAEIRSLNKEVVEAHRTLCIEQKKKPSKNGTTSRTTTTTIDADADEEQHESDTPTINNKKKSYTDDEVRKFIVEQREKTLQNAGVRIAGSTQHEKMDAAHKDMTLVSEFLCCAQTSRGYYVYAYYVGPESNQAVELHNTRNWLLVHKTHLTHFHKRLRDLKPFYTHTKYDQKSFAHPGALNDTPSYDPRFIMHKWLAKEGHPHKALLQRHRPLFKLEKDFVTEHYNKEAEEMVVVVETKPKSVLHYYDDTHADNNVLIDLTRRSMDVDEKKQSGALFFNAEQDRLRQQAHGYKLTDKELCHVTIEDFPPLSRVPLPASVTLSFEEFLSIAQRVHVNERQPQPPEFYVCDPLVMVKAALMALNFEAQIKRVAPLICDAKLQILEADNMKPILDYLASHQSCTEAVKDATFRSLLAFMAVELMTREQPAHIKEALEKMGAKELVLLDS